MGNVIFNTDVDKTVDINKNVNVNVNKNVTTNVDLNGSLASAEASADAVGGGNGNGNGEEVKVPFIPDNLTEPQQAEANPQDTNPATSTITVPGDDTDFNNPLERTLFAEVLGATGEGDLAVQIVQPGKLTFDQGDGTFSNALADWEIEGGEDPFPLDDNAGIIQDFLDNVDPDSPDPLADVCYTYTFSDITFDPGLDAEGNPATVRVSFLVEDTAGNQAITTAAFVPGDDGGGFDGLNVTAAFAPLIDETLAAPPGTVLAEAANGASIVLIGQEDDVDDNGASVNFDTLGGFQILLEDDPNTVTDGNTVATGDLFAVDSVIDESLSVSGTDASTSIIWTTCEEEEDVFNIAETETFAQVTEDGAFSFSDALAASNAGVIDDLL